MGIDQNHLFIGAFLAILASFLLINFWFVLTVVKTLKRVNQNLGLLPDLIVNFKGTSERLNEAIETSKDTLKSVDNLVQELKIIPKIVAEVGDSLKDLEAFLKGQIEVIKDDLHFTLEDAQSILKDMKGISQELRGRIDTLNQTLTPFLGALRETAETSRTVLTDLNRKIKTTYVEVSSVTAGVLEVLSGLKKLFGLKGI